MKRGAWNVNSITLTSELAAIRTPSTRPGPPPNAASATGIAAKITMEKTLPQTNNPPAVTRAFSPRAWT